MRAIRGLSLLTALALCASPATGQTAAEKYGSHMGLDIAFAPDNTAVYVQVRQRLGPTVTTVHLAETSRS